jgi:DivIVA domain-containing protein
VDGDATETTGTDATEPTTPEVTEPEPRDPPAERLSALQLRGYVERASFATTLGRRGYQQGEVDALMVKISETIRAAQPLADLVRRSQLTAVRLEDGYDAKQVDDFLAAVVDLDPHAEPVRPAAARSGLVTKLFG